MKIRYMCESCSRTHELKSFIFPCIFCGDEICDQCMWDYATCKACKSDKTPEEIKQKCNEVYET